MMAAQVEVQTGDVGRTVAGGRLHLNPLTDSSNKGLVEINQSHIISPEPNKPIPGPKPRLTPKPYAVERNPTIKPILAPKPQTKPRPESTRLVGYKPEPPRIPKPQQPVATVKTRPVSFNPNRPAPTSFKTSNQVNTGQTTKPVVQPFKPAPPFDPGDPSKPDPPVPAERRKPGASSLGYSKSLKNLPAAEWSGTTKIEDEKDKTTSSNGGASITRAKSMGFLAEVGQEEEERGNIKSEGAVALRPQQRSSRPRPVSALFLDGPTKTEAPGPSPRWVGRRPLSADLTSKFESIGLSLHRKSQKANTKENTPEETALPQRSEQERTPKTNTPQSAGIMAKPAVSDQSNKEMEEMAAKESDENKRVASIKSRISLFLDSPLAPGTGAAVQGSDLQSLVQPEKEPPVGVKKLIKQLTEDTPPTQSPVVKPTLRPRPLPLDLTKRFSSEWSPDFGSVPLSEATDHHDITKDPQMRNEELTPKSIDHRTFVDSNNSHEQLQKASLPEGPEAGHTSGATSEESGPSAEVQTVRASLFENVVERHSVHMVDKDKPVNKPRDLLRSLSFKRGNGEDEGTLVTATYKEPIFPPSPLRVPHAVDTVQAVEQNRAVSENVPSAQWEDKAATLRSRRSEGSRPIAEGTGSAQAEPTLAVTPEPQTRYLRVGALPKWTSAGHGQDAGGDNGILKESLREGGVAVDEERHREAEQEEVAAAPKRLKMLQTEEQQKPRATYFALTGQMQEPFSPIDAGAHIGDTEGPFDDFSVRAALGGSQGKILPLRRNPSFGKNSPDQAEDLRRSHVSNNDIRSALDGQTAEDAMEVAKKREAEKHKGIMRELEREKQRQLELEKQSHLDFARMKEREMQREFERERQKAFEKEKQEFEKKQRALERQRQIELEKQRLQELEQEKQRELEREWQRHLEKERRQQLEREREIEREKLHEQEREKLQEQERLRQREKERQRELDKERQLLEIQKEKQKMDELERQQLLEFQRQKQREKERQQLIELEKQRLREKKEREEAEKMKQMALEQEMLRLMELEREREQQREMEKARQKEMEREKQKEMEREKQKEMERQRQLDAERKELDDQRSRQQEKERQRREELDRLMEMERIRLLEFEKQKHAEKDRQLLLEFEKRRQREQTEREEAEKMRQVAKQQEAERQRLREKQERARSESSPLRPKVLDLDSMLRNEPFPKPATQRSDPATRWKEPSPRVEEPYKPAILDIDAFTSQSQSSPSRDLLSGIQGGDAGFGARIQPTPERDISWKVPSQTSLGQRSPVWSPQDPWELKTVEMSMDKPAAEPRKHSHVLSPEQLLLRQGERLLTPQRHWSPGDEPTHPAPFPSIDAKPGAAAGAVNSSAPADQVWFLQEPQPPETGGEVGNQRRSQGSQELNRMRSRSVSRRSAPSSSAVETSLSRMRSRSGHRERDSHSWVQQKQSVSGEEEGDDDSETPVRDNDSQYGTWETGLRTDDSLTPASPSSESNLSPSPRKHTSPHTPGDRPSQFESDALDGLLPRPSSSSQPLPFPEVPTALLDTSALRSRAQLGKKRAPRTRPTRAARQSAPLPKGGDGTTEDWLYRDSTEAKVESKDDDWDPEGQTRGADAPSAAAVSQPQRVALFPGLDPSALKAQLKKRGDSDNQSDGPSPSQLSRSPKSPFLPRATRVLPPPGGKENGEEDSPQWLKELKSKKRLSQYENDS